MKVQMFQIDAFAARLFEGNPAAVCLLPEWIDEKTLQQVAAENNLSETAFLVADGDDYQIRWFTPTVEVGLCGHATLASGYAVLELLHPGRSRVTFRSSRDELTVARVGSEFEMNFPAVQPEVCDPPRDLQEVLGTDILSCFQNEDLFVHLGSEQEIRALAPAHELLLPFSKRGVVVTAEGEDVDFVSRAFFPAVGISEDPVTGSTHCTLAPYWGARLGKTVLRARQLSKRGGELECELQHQRVLLRGSAQLYLSGEVNLPTTN